MFKIFMFFWIYWTMFAYLDWATPDHHPLVYHNARFPFWFGAMHFVHTVCFNLRYRLRRLVSTKLLQLSFLWSQTAIKKERVHQGKNFAFFCQNLKLNMKFFLFKRSGHAFLQFCNCWHFFGKFYSNDNGQDLRKTQAKN